MQNFQVDVRLSECCGRLIRDIDGFDVCEACGSQCFEHRE